MTSLRSTRSKPRWPRSVRGEVFRLPAPGSRLPDECTSSAGTSARRTSFRPEVEIAGRRTLVMCDQIGAVDLRRLTERAGSLTMGEMHAVDDALSLVLDL